VVAVDEKPRHIWQFVAVVATGLLLIGGIWLGRFTNATTPTEVTPEQAARTAAQSTQSLSHDGYLYSRGELITGEKAVEGMVRVREQEARKTAAESEEHAARVRAVLRRKQKEMQDAGAFYSAKAAAEAEREYAHLPIVRREAEAAYYGYYRPTATSAVHLAEAEAAAVNRRDFERESVRLTYQSNRLRAVVDIQEVQEAFPASKPVMMRSEVIPRPEPVPSAPAPSLSSQFRPRTLPVPPSDPAPATVAPTQPRSWHYECQNGHYVKVYNN